MDCIERLLGVEKVSEVLGVCKRGVYRLVHRGDLRQPVKVGKCSRWPESEIIEYQERIKRERRR